MSRRDTIINELEKDFGIEVDANEDFDVLCNGETCRHAECDCWDELRSVVSKHLEAKSHTITFSDGTPVELDEQGIVKLPSVEEVGMFVLICVAMLVLCVASLMQGGTR